jgi:hypothetical protein
VLVFPSVAVVGIFAFANGKNFLPVLVFPSVAVVGIFYQRHLRKQKPEQFQAKFAYKSR